MTACPIHDGPWDYSGPEEGDGDDTVLICNADDPSYEIIVINGGSLRKRKAIAKKITALLNEGEATLMR